MDDNRLKYYELINNTKRIMENRNIFVAVIKDMLTANLGLAVQLCIWTLIIRVFTWIFKPEFTWNMVLIPFAIEAAILLVIGLIGFIRLVNFDHERKESNEKMKK